LSIKFVFSHSGRSKSPTTTARLLVLSVENKIVNKKTRRYGLNFNLHWNNCHSHINNIWDPSCWRFNCCGARSLESSVFLVVSLARAALFRNRWQSGELFLKLLICVFTKLVDGFLERFLALFVSPVVVLDFIEIFSKDLAAFVLIGCIRVGLAVCVLNK
jgi:hypothetical protein